MISFDQNKMYKLQGERTDQEFADYLGVSRSQLWRIKTERCSAGPVFIEKVLKAFPDTSMSDIFLSHSVPLKEHKRERPQKGKQHE